jgi:hypothetical protein
LNSLVGVVCFVCNMQSVVRADEPAKPLRLAPTDIEFPAVSGAQAGTSGNPAGGVSGGLTAAGSALNRVPLFSRNFFRQPKIWNVDLRVSRRFHFTERTSLAIVAEAFNLFNRTQVTALNTRLYIIGGTATASTLTFDPSFGTLSATGNALMRERQIQLAVRFEF